MTVQKLTPNLYADDVEACVKFWVERMQFEVTAQVPDGESLAFAALQKGTIELMYGSYASLDKDPAVAASYRRGTSFLFIEVDDLQTALAAMTGAPIVLPEHRTFYGATEFTVKDPAGHLITFAHFAKP
jgi:catechol 2,3-dioxygenase-like lactoylglutathione lyase family enzyme